MKFNNLISILLILCCVIFVKTQISPAEDKKHWCWTKSMANEPNFILNPSQGGLNWGYCQKSQVEAVIKYTAIINTSQIEKSETNSAIKIRIYGDKGKSDDRMLSSNGFERGTEKLVEFEARDVGIIHKIGIKVNGGQGYRCKNIMIRKGNLSTNFECIKRIEPCKPGSDPRQCILEINADGDTPYQVTIKTSDEIDGGTKSPVLISLKGVKGESRLKIFNELGLDKGSTQTTSLNLKDLGEITGFKLMLGAHGKWKPIYLSVKSMITGIVKNFEILNKVLISPGNESYSYNQNDKPDVNKEEEKPQTVVLLDEKESLNIHDSHGGLIDAKEKKNIVNLSCEQELINPTQDNMIFGPDYPTRNINYMSILARCPSDCHKVPGVVIGVGIHPETSPICLSAIVDRATSQYGGIISISIFPGEDSYKIPDKFPDTIYRISVKSLHSKSIMKSYIVSKVDNLDLVEKDIRIVNDKGQLAAEGRLEMRIEGRWGTICSIGNNRQSAKIICKNLSYRDGEWKSPQEGEIRDFCRTYKGFDYCGAEGSRIHYEKMDCNLKDDHINSCNKELANYKQCSHSTDSIIRCFNEVYETNIPIPVGVVNLNAISNEKDSVTGRLEMFNDQEFSPVCDLGFNDESASIACKQMGYLKGEQVNPPNSKRFKLIVSSDKKFAASNIDCRGHEKTLKECRSVMKGINCKHDQDTVIKCYGDKGDPTGKSQYLPKIVTPAPELGKLGLSKKKIKCSTNGNDIFFRGDPGSVYLLECPAMCTKKPGIITGTGLYTGDSNICLAAVHSGVINDTKGGLFAYIKSFGQIKYDTSTRYNLLSDPLGMIWTSSFSLSKVNSGWLNMNKVFEDKMGSDQKKNKILSTSFLELKSEDDKVASIPKSAYSFVEPNPNFQFKQDKNFLFDNMNVPHLDKWTTIAKFKMDKFIADHDHFIISTGCSGFNIVISKRDSLVLGNICDSEKKLDTQIIVPLNESILLFASYYKGLVKIIFHTEKLGMIRKEIKFNMEIDQGRANAISLGKGSQNDGIFYGEINFVNIYDSVIDEKMIPLIVQRIKGKDIGILKKKKTEDGRDCLSPCVDIKPGEGNSPKEAKLDAGNDESSIPNKDANGKLIKEEGEGGKGDKNKNSDYGTYDKIEESNQETITLDCVTTLEDKRFQGQQGKVFRIHCPVCTKEKVNVFGTGIYHPLSSICKAALHWGVATKGNQSDLILELTGKKEFFTGSKGKDSSLSGSFAGAETSFKLKLAKKLKHLKCTSKASEDLYLVAPVHTKFVVTCPKNCSKIKQGGDIFGSEVYSDDSSICIAAIHCGVLNDLGGEIEFMIEGEQPGFKSTKGFGITSKPRDAYIRSFKFLGHKSAISLNFKDDYLGHISEKWKVVQDLNAIDKLKDNWNYLTQDLKNANGIFEKIHGIAHSGTVRLTKEISAGSMLILKDKEFANGIIRLNLKFKDLSPLLIIFRYADSENYYSIEIFPRTKSQNIKLLSKVNSSIKVVDSKTIPWVRTGIWFRCMLILNFGEMKFLMQQENVREHKLIFNRNLSEIPRGSFGFGSNGNNNFLISGIQIDEYKPNLANKALANTNKIRTFEVFLTKFTSKDIKSFCHKIYKKETIDYKRCQLPHVQCQMRCDSIVPKDQENLINFRCFQDCVKNIYNIIMTENNERGKSIVKKWEPKEQMKVDFLVNGDTMYRPGNILEIQSKMKKKMITVEYQDETEEVKKAIVMYPSRFVVKCGNKLPSRKDCLNV